MFTNEDIIKLASSQLNIDLSDIEIISAQNVIAIKKDGKITVGGKNIPQKLRALSLCAINKEKEEFSIEQSPAFKNLGIMADMSRGGVMRAEKVKEFILKAAHMGTNQFMLYTEDIYTLEDYPHFGYLRGAYTDEELLDIDDFAYNLGVELIPCIQTLGHMAQYLTWSEETNKFKDTDAVLLCDSEETYKFIEAEIVKMKKLFRSSNIHIGMDEAWDMGLGQYIRKFGFKERYSVLKRHLARVVGICEKYELNPMMWSDMFFRLGSDVDEYFDPDVKFPEEVKNNMPNVNLVYWDYYHTKQEFYEKMIDRHFELDRPVVFAGSSYSTRGFLPIIPITFETSEPALKACIKKGVTDVWATLWGDDGCETNYFDSLYGFAMYSEMCYNPDYTQADIDAMGSLLTKITPEIVEAIRAYFIRPYPKAVIWGDVFYNVLCTDFEKDTKYLAVKDAMEKCSDEYTKLVLDILYTKASIYANMQKCYKSGGDMSIYSEKILPELLEKFKKLKTLFCKRWKETNKVFGLETIQMRFNTSIGRLEYAIEVVDSFVKKETEKIEELEYEPVYTSGRLSWYNYTVSGRVANFF